MMKRKANKGSFKPGPDPRRHKFTRDECVDGFWAAIESIMARYPEAVTSYHAHMVVNFLPAVIARREQQKRSRAASC